MRNCLFIVGLALAAPIMGCGDNKSATELEIPESNPYQKTPEEMEAYNASISEKMKSKSGQ